MSFQATFKTDGFSPDGLVAQNSQLLLSEPVTVLSGQGKLVRGTLLGKITASGKYVKSLSASADGSQTPAAILADDVDATSADAPGLGYTRGDFQAQALVLGAGHTVASVAAGLADKGIFLINTQA